MTVVYILTILFAVSIAFIFASDGSRGRFHGILGALSDILSFRKNCGIPLVRLVYCFGACYCVIYGIYAMFKFSFWFGLMYVVVYPVVLYVASAALIAILSMRRPDR